MASPQSALRRHSDAHIHPQTETCPVCEQPIPNEKAKEIQARAEARERSLADAANARAADQIAAERTRIEAAAKEAVDEAIAKTAVKVEEARTEAREAAEAAAQERLAEAERARAEAEAAAAERIAAFEQAANVREATWQAKVLAADNEKQQALAQVQALKVGQEELINERVREAREALERANADALANTKAAHDAEKRNLTTKLEGLQRQLEKQRADELGEGAEVKLFDALKVAFPGDNIRRVAKGVSGADILHTVMHTGRECGTIIYDSKNSLAWRDDYVAKLIRDQTAAKAGHAILSTFKFPAGAAQIEIRDGVIIVNPARATAVARLLRRHMLLVHTLRLSKTERAEKMAALYDFITSDRCSHLLERIDSHTESLLIMQEKEIKAHQNHWRQEGQLVRSIQKVKAELDTEIDAIIGSDEPVE